MSDFHDTGLTCLRCGSSSVIPDAHLIDRGEADNRKPAHVGIIRKPEAWIFKEEERVQTRAQVCGVCGYVELFVKDPEALWEAYLDREGNRS